MPRSASDSLWTPGGEVPIREKGVIPINQGELIMLSRLHKFAQKYDITIICKRCDSAITGKNSGHESQPGISCLCREFRYSR